MEQRPISLTVKECLGKFMHFVSNGINEQHYRTNKNADRNKNSSDKPKKSYQRFPRFEKLPQLFFI